MQEQLIEPVDTAFAAGSHLALGQRQENLIVHSTGQRVSHVRQHHQVGGTGQQEASWATVLVDRLLDGEEQVRSALDFIDYCGINGTNQADGVFPCSREGGGIVEAEIGASC